MRIREYTAADLDALRLLHAAQSFGYPFPDLESPLFISRLVLEETAHEAGDNAEGNTGREEAIHDSLSEDSASPKPGRITMAVLLRLTAEAYLLHNPQAGTPRQRWHHLLALHEATRRSAIACGLDDVQAFLPPRIARAFGRRLARLGWTQDPWPCFSRRMP